jgi:hypothetical protein
MVLISSNLPTGLASRRRSKQEFKTLLLTFTYYIMLTQLPKVSKLQSIRKKHPEGDLLTIGDRVIEMMENNPDFPDPPAALEALKNVMPEFRTALANALGRDRLMGSIKNDKKAIVLKLLSELSWYVMATCKGDKTLLLSSGFDVVGESRSPQEPAIEKLYVEIGIPNEATTHIRNVTAAIAYVHEYATEEPNFYTAWTSKGSSQGSYTFTKLTSDKRYWFRVVAIGRGGKIGYSPIVSRVIQ